jgi:hypothetical protein
MLMTVISLAISLVSIQGFSSLANQESSSNTTAQTQQIQQENRNATHPEFLLKGPRTVAVSPQALPPGDNVWMVKIFSRGGFTGSGRGDLTLTSEGIVTWSAADGSCGRKLTDEALQALAKMVLAAHAPATGSESSLSGMCFDCYVTTMILLRRGTEGVVSATTVSWDDASQAQVAADLVSIYKAAIAHKGCNL